MLAMPGPGVGGPGPGVLCWLFVPVRWVRAATSQLEFRGPEGMSIQWDVAVPGSFDSQPLVAPGRYNFPQAAIYRLKLTNLPGRPGVELYPTMEVAPATAADRRLPGAQRDSGAVHRRGLRPGLSAAIS